MESALPGLDRTKLHEQVRVELERVLKEVADAVDDALKGRVIRDSEHKVRDAMDGFQAFVYEAAMQLKVNAAEADVFPPTSATTGKRKRHTRMLGWMRPKRRSAKACGRWPVV